VRQISVGAALWLACASFPPALCAQASSLDHPLDSAAGALVLHARALDRASALDSARSAYELAARRIPIIADWLRLRAAGVTADSAARLHDYADVTTPAARARIPWTEALARERTGDLAGAARAYLAVGAPIDALRDSVAAAAASRDTAGRAALREALVRRVTVDAGTPAARTAGELLDRFFAPLTIPEERAVARSAALTGPAARVASAFDRIVAGGGADSLTPPDRFAYGLALVRLHRDTEAAHLFASVVDAGEPATAAQRGSGARLRRGAVARTSDATRRPAASTLRPATAEPLRSAPPAADLTRDALYEEGRALVAAGDKAGGRRVLRSLVRRARRDSATANGLMLLADLATDDRNDAAARRAFLQAARVLPASPLASRARFRAALIAYIAGDPRGAAREWDALVARAPGADDASAARYWSGRAWARAGKHASAAARWRAVLATDPLSYYASLSARRLHLAPPLAAAAGDPSTAALPPAVDSALQRIAALERVGLAVEARDEAEWVVRAVGTAPRMLLAAGSALTGIGAAPRAVALGWHLVARTDSAWRDPQVLRLVYPLLYGDTIVAAARRHALDPALVAAIVRQESAFDPRATSAVGARGLMQLMPGVARGLVAARGVAPWDAGLLDEPALNIELGVTHFATFLAQQHGDIIRTLAAYNAGPSRVVTWSAKRGASDPEVFIERIPFAETRDYVRAIVHGRDVYAALYPSLR